MLLARGTRGHLPRDRRARHIASVGEMNASAGLGDKRQRGDGEDQGPVKDRGSNSAVRLREREREREREHIIYICGDDGERTENERCLCGLSRPKFALM